MSHRLFMGGVLHHVVIGGVIDGVINSAELP